jgi:signal transduction histidine kinase
MAASVEQRIGELTETAERQRLFISGVTHEFKTPLTALLLNVDSLQNTCMREDEQAETLDRISQQSRWLEQLVQKLLKLITLNQLPALKPVSVPPLLDRVRDNTEASLSARGITLETCCTVDRLNLDADLMQSVLVNLVDNAAKASSDGQTVMLSASPEGFTVQDRGCGIPQDEINRITEPFYMVDRSRNKKTGGMGLGLALVKEIVAAHGGTLEIKSEVGAGTTARVLLKQS